MKRRVTRLRDGLRRETGQTRWYCHGDEVDGRPGFYYNARKDAFVPIGGLTFTYEDLTRYRLNRWALNRLNVAALPPDSTRPVQDRKYWRPVDPPNVYDAASHKRGRHPRDKSTPIAGMGAGGAP